MAVWMLSGTCFGEDGGAQNIMILPMSLRWVLAFLLCVPVRSFARWPPCHHTQLCYTHFFTHNFVTHLLRTVIANSDMECILRAKTLQIHLTGMGRWKDPRKIEKCEENANGLALYFEPGPAMQCTCNHSHVVSHGVALSYTVSSVCVIQSAVAMQLPAMSTEHKYSDLWIKNSNTSKISASLTQSYLSVSAR